MNFESHQVMLRFNICTFPVLPDAMSCDRILECCECNAIVFAFYHSMMNGVLYQNNYKGIHFLESHDKNCKAFRM